MPYRSSKTANIMATRSVLDVALDVHMTNTGAYDRPSQDQQDDLSVLREYLDNWRPSIPKECERFDNAVKEVIQAALVEAG